MIQFEDWIDYMEGEADLKTMAKLGLLIEHSYADREILSNLLHLRMLIERVDPALEIEPRIQKAGFLDDLHERVMSFIEGNQPEAKRSTAAPPKPLTERADDSRENSSVLD